MASARVMRSPLMGLASNGWAVGNTGWAQQYSTRASKADATFTCSPAMFNNHLTSEVSR